MVQITLRNDKAKIVCPTAHLIKLRNEFRIRVPGAWFSDAFRKRTWDGYAHYITEAGYFALGLLPGVIEKLDKFGFDYEIDDLRQTIKPNKVVTKFKKVELRGYQLDAVNSLVHNKVGKIPFQRGVLNEATNAGKIIIAASIFKTYPDDSKLIFIVNREHLYKQSRKELTELIGDKEMGHIGPDGVKWNRFMICMAQTLSKGNYHSKLPQFDICIIDECHYASSPSYKYILNGLDGSSVRIGMSGTPFKHKDKNKNQRILSFFGPATHVTTNKQLIDQGFSTPMVVTILEGNTLVKIPGDYKAEETEGLIMSKERNGKVIKRVRQHINKGRSPLLLICKFHNHTELLFKRVKKAFPELRVNYIHVKVKNRMQILEQFREGELDILVSSKLIKEGQNLPLIKAVVNASGGDSAIDVLQIVGRALRKHKSKKKVYYDDFFDEGSYLKRHSKHRIKELKGQEFKLIQKYGKGR
jgi:superfamily II DNA or RNA helicase